MCGLASVVSVILRVVLMLMLRKGAVGLWPACLLLLTSQCHNCPLSPSQPSLDSSRPGSKTSCSDSSPLLLTRTLGPAGHRTRETTVILQPPFICHIKWALCLSESTWAPRASTPPPPPPPSPETSTATWTRSDLRPRRAGGNPGVECMTTTGPWDTSIIRYISYIENKKFQFLFYLLTMQNSKLILQQTSEKCAFLPLFYSMKKQN